jgi:hypothetical protein
VSKGKFAATVLNKTRLALLALLLPVLGWAFSSLGILDGLIPGSQLVFLSPNGRVLALPKGGGLPAVVGITNAPTVVPPNLIAIGGAMVIKGGISDSIAMPVKDVNGAGYILLRAWNGSNLRDSSRHQAWFASSPSTVEWAGDTLVYLASGKRGWMMCTGAQRLVQNQSSSNSATMLGVKVWPNGSGYRVLSWNGSQVWVSGTNLATDTLLPNLPTGVQWSGAGFWKASGNRQWVLLAADKRIFWQTGVVDTAPQVGRLLPDDSLHSGSVLLWTPASGELWRLSPGVRQRLASSIADVMSAGTPGNSQYLLLGGTLATAAATLGEGIRFLGSLHQPGHPEIGSFRVDPALFSPKLIGASITAGILAPGSAAWRVWLKRPKGDTFTLQTGSVLPSGTLSLQWSGKISNGTTPDSTGMWKAFIQVVRGPSTVLDSTGFELDAIAPVGAGIWSTSSSTNTVSPTTPWSANLTGAIDNKDSTRPVTLVVRFARNGQVYTSSFLRSSRADHKWTFNGQLSDGSMLPEGDYDAKWTLVDGAGNASDSSSAFVTGVTGAVRVRWSGPSVRASVTPIQVAASAPISTFVHVDVSGTALAYDTIKITGPDSVKANSVVVRLDTKGVGTADIPVTSKARTAGTWFWSVVVSESGLSSTASAVMFVGAVGPRISYPSNGTVLKAKGGSIIVRGIAPDPSPKDTGTAVYRLSLHPGSLAVPASTNWAFLKSLPSTQLLSVMEAKALPGAARITQDLSSIPGSVGTALRLGLDENLATFDPRNLRDTLYTLVLWTGKGELVQTASATFTLDRSGFANRSISLPLLSPLSGILDRSDSDTANDTLRWLLSGASGLSSTLSVWTTGLGIVSQRVWQGSPMDSSVKFGGYGSDGKALPTGSYVMRATSANLDGQWIAESPFTVVASPLSWNSSLLKVSPSYVDFSMARILGGALQLQCKVALPRLDTTRLVIRGPNDTSSILAVVGQKTVSSWEGSWTGEDQAGRLWLDPTSSPFAGASTGRLVVGLERKQGGAWFEIDRDTVRFGDMLARQVASSSLTVQGKTENGLRVADLISDYKLRAQFAGNLLYFPPRDVTFDIRPYGKQVVRQYFPTDYQIYWAKYYNSIAGFENYSGDYESNGWYLSWGRTRHDDRVRQVMKKQIPFWMLANAGNTGMGVRSGMNVVSPNANGIDRTMRVGIPPRYQPDLDSEMIEIQRESMVYRFSPKAFFGSGVNSFNYDVSSDPFSVTNSGYSGYHEDDPIGALFAYNKSRYDVTADTNNFQFCNEIGSTGTYRDPQPVEYDQSLERLMIRALTVQHPEWARCPSPQHDSLPSPWTLRCLCYPDGRRALRWGTWDPRIDSTFAFAYQACEDSTLAAVYINMKNAGIAIPQSPVTLQDYFSNIVGALNGSAWSAPDNISASFHLTRPRTKGVIDDAWWLSAPTDWSQSYYVYGPGYRKIYHDSVGVPLYSLARRFDEVLTQDGSFHNRIQSIHDSEIVRVGFDRIIPADSTKDSTSNSDDFKYRLRPGQGPWFMRKHPSFTGCCSDDWGYKYSIGNNYHHYTKMDDPWGMKVQTAYTVPPRLNWMNPWFYVGDTGTTVVRKMLYANDSLSWTDEFPWGDVNGERTNNSLATLGGYKEGQVGYWFRPALDSEHRVFRANAYGEILSEVDYVKDYSHHIHLDPSNPGVYSNHNLRFEPRLVVSPRTRGVVWDTVGIDWPLPGATADHIDASSMQDSGFGDTTNWGRTWIQVHRTLQPDSLWIPRVTNFGATAADSIRLSLWSLFPRLPGEPLTGGVTGRMDSLYNFVRLKSLAWGVSPLDARGMLIPDQTRLRWNLNLSSDTTFTWLDRWKNATQNLTVRKPVLTAGYVLQPDTLQAWSSQQDPILKDRSGWIYLRDSMNPSPMTGFDPVHSNISLVPTSAADSVVQAAPCYRPWVTSAFVRVHDSGSSLCKDSLGLNPNLLLSGSQARWNVEIYYPDGQTPNLDLGQGSTSNLQSMTLRLSDNRSSQRWVRLQGGLADTIQNGGKTFSLVRWRVFGSNNGQAIDLDLPVSQTDSVQIKVGIHKAKTGDNTWTPSDVPDLAWWNVTGQQGASQFLVQGVYANATDSLATWTKVPFVLGQPRVSNASTKVADAYGRATLNMPPDSTNSGTPIVLNTLSGQDLASLPLAGAVPMGPVIKMSPSGTRFSTPATLQYRMTLRELLSQMNRPASKDSLVTTRAKWSEAWTWAISELAIWEISDGGQFEAAPTSLTFAGDTSGSLVSLDNLQVVLTGLISHFSYAAVLHKDPSKNLAPRWISAIRSGTGLAMSLDAQQAISLGAKPQLIRVRLSATPSADTGKFALGEMVLTLHQGRIDTVVASLPSAWSQILSRTSGYLFARFDGGSSWSSIVVRDSSSKVSFGPVTVAPSFAHSNCSDTVRLSFNSNLSGIARAKVVNSSGTVVGNLLGSVVAGLDTLKWSVCNGATPAPKGLYRALVEAIQVDGTSVADSSLNLAVWGIDTLVPSLGAIQVPDPAMVPREVAGVSISATDTGWPSTTTWSAKIRRVFDERGVGADSVWRALATPIAASDSVRAVWDARNGLAWAPRGTYQVQLQGLAGSFKISRTALFGVDTETSAISLSLSSTATPYQGDRVPAALTGSNLASWKLRILKDSNQIGELTGVGSRNLSLQLLLRTDTLPSGRYKACAIGMGLLGSNRQVCQDLVIRPLVPRLASMTARPSDTLWSGWPEGTFQRHRNRVNTWVLTGQADRSGRLIRQISRNGLVVRQDTLPVLFGSFAWTWDGRVSGKLLPEGLVQIKVWADNATSSPDTSYSWSIQIHRVPRAFVWAGTVADTLAATLVNSLTANGVLTSRGDASAASEYLLDNPKGTLVMLDTAISSKLWSGRSAGGLIPWTLSGGNAVFAGAPALSAWRDSLGAVRKASDTDYARMSIYGGPTAGTSAAAQRSFARGIRYAGLRVDSLDDFSRRIWSHDTGSIMSWSLRLRWFDSIGVDVESGLLKHRVDSLHQLNQRGRDSVYLDSNLAGSLNYYPAQDAGLRKGQILELPQIAGIADASNAGQLIWTQLLVPDFGISRSDVRVAAAPVGARTSAQWRPIPGDSLKLSLSIRVRDGGMDTLPDSAVLDLKKIPGLWNDTVLVVKHLKTGTIALPQLPVKLPVNFPYGQASIAVSIRPFQLGTLAEQYLGNNSIQGQFLVGDIAAPGLAWKDRLDGQFAGLPLRLAPVAAGKPFFVTASAWSRHHQSRWSYAWELRSSQGNRLDGDSTTSTQSDSTRWVISGNIDPDATDGSMQSAMLRAHDAFNNTDSIQVRLRVDAVKPVLGAFTVGGRQGGLDTANGNLVTFRLPSNAKAVDTASIAISDNQQFGRVILVTSAGDSVSWLDTVKLGSLNLKRPVPVTKITPYDTVTSENVMSLVVRDLAGNDTTVRFQVISEPPPLPQIFHVRIPSNGGTLQYPTILDSFSSSLSRSRVDSMVRAGQGFVLRPIPKEDTENAIYGWTNGDSGIQVRQSHRGVPMDFVFAPQTNGQISLMSVTMDGNVVNTPPAAFQAYGDLLSQHPTQRLIEITPSKAHHRLVFRASDAYESDSLVLMLDDSLADLQVVDSSQDHNGLGADWGEVYMRRNVYQPSGISLPQTWDYWLIQRRNSMAPGERDNHIYRLLVDADGDSATGDTTNSIPRGFKGADVTLEWTNLTTADDGSAAQVTMYRWNDTLKHWIQSASGHEGLDLLAGYGFHQNEPDNPNTDSLGRGDQRLPSGVVAPASAGVTEIGVRSGLTNSLHPIRWAIVPDGFAGDTVRDSSGGMLKFEPRDYKPVNVDGDASEWWPNNTPINIEVRSKTDTLGDSLRVLIGLKNSSTRTIRGVNLVYWIMSDSIPTASLSEMPYEWRRMRVASTVVDSSKIVDTLRRLATWRISISCDSCMLPGGSYFSPVAFLKIKRNSPKASSALDWSNSFDSSIANPHFTAYDASGVILFGSEPPPRALRLPVARITPSGVLWTTVGQPLVLRADSSFDPERRQLSYQWWHSRTGTNNTSTIDTFVASRPGVYEVSLKVFDGSDLQRSAWATDSIYVQDTLGAMGARPVLADAVYLFDDQWDSKWQSWDIQDSAKTVDSLFGLDGTRHAINPARGTKLLSVPFDSASDYTYLRATCDSSYWNANGTPWCPDEIDLSKFTNLEFKIAMDAGLKDPIRVWLDRVMQNNGQGNGAREEDFAYVNSYLKDMSDPSHWQTVSIPLKEIYTEPQLRQGWLQLKFMTNTGRLTSAMRYRPRVLLDDIRLVKYKTVDSQIVTTRKTGLQVMANTIQYGDPSQLSMVVRLLNQGSLPLQLDSLRLRAFYQSKQFQTIGDTTWVGPDTVALDWNRGMPTDSTIDGPQLKMAALSHDSLVPPGLHSNHFGEIRWVGNTSGPDVGLKLQSTASASFWFAVENYSGRLAHSGLPANRIPMTSFDGVRSLAWSWPNLDSIDQFAPHIILDHLMSNGDWVRAWGLAPNEDSRTVSYWTPEDLVDPVMAIDSIHQIRAHITVNGNTTPGARLFASADASVDPLGHPLQFHWIDSIGRVIRVGSIDSFVVPDTGKIVLRLRAFDILDPTRVGLDSVTVWSTSSAKAIDSLQILTGSRGTWIPGSAWGSTSTAFPSWKASVDLVARDGSCPVRLLPIAGDSILSLPFSSVTLDGVRFDAPTAALDRNRFTHLEFWVASSREWPTRNHRDVPVRIWLTHQVQPGTGDNNHSSEEDFNLIQAYLPSSHLLRRWQKVSIPLDELYQTSLSANSDMTKLFLKFMLDNTASSEVDSARRADLYLTGIRFAKYDPGTRVTTRRIGAIAVGSAYPIPNLGSTRMDFRLLNVAPQPLFSDSLRIRAEYWNSSSVGSSFSNNIGAMGTDESVSSNWFVPQDTAWSFALSTDIVGRNANRGHQLTWASSVPLAAGKGWEAIWSLGFSDSVFSNGQSRQHFAPDASPSSALFDGIVIDYKQAGGWKRLWGTEAWESPDTVTYWAREGIRVPADTAMPSAAVVNLSGACVDSTGLIGTTTNTSIAAGDVAALPSTGRDPLLITQSVTDAGRKGVQVIQSKPDWNIKHTFIFDTAWVHHSVVDVEVYVDPAQMTGTAWAGTLMASTFDNQTWSTLELTPLSGTALDSAVGKWITLRFQYNPASYVLGRPFDLQFLANGHGNGTSSFKFDIGSVSVEGASGSGGDSTVVDTNYTAPSNSISMDSLSRFISCNQCAIVTDGSRKATAFAPVGGGTALAFTVPVDSSLTIARTLSFDLKSEFVLQGWEQAWFFVDDSPYRYNWDQYLANIPNSVSTGWTTINIPFSGSLYGLGTTAKFMLSVNANAPNGTRMLVDNVRWTP